MSYSNIYNKRLNRYGTNYQERIQGEREKNFSLYLLKTIYRVDFLYNNTSYAGSLERNKQDETEIKYYLLTQTSLNMPNGTILSLTNKDNVSENWMVYYLENIKASGYNRYIMLKMTHQISWKSTDGIQRTSYAYLYGQEDNMLKDELKSRSRIRVIYNESTKSSFIVMPKNEYIQKDIYLDIGTGAYKQGFVVTGFDLLSTEGVEYVTIDPVYTHDLTLPPTPPAGSETKDYYWFNGGTT